MDLTNTINNNYIYKIVHRRICNKEMVQVRIKIRKLLKIRYMSFSDLVPITKWHMNNSGMWVAETMYAPLSYAKQVEPWRY